MFKKSHQRLTWKTLSFHCIILSIICQVLGGLFVFNNPASAVTTSVNSFYFDDYEADFYLSEASDGTSRLRVVEKFTAVFPSTISQNHGITRVIPYTNQDGQNLTMKSDDYIEINVKQNGKNVEPYKVESGDGYFTVYIGDPDTYVRGEQIYELEYEFRNVITEFNDDGKKWQELYWDTNGNDWSQRFEHILVRLHFEDDEIAKAYTGETSCYVGYYGTSGQNRCTTTKISNGVQFEAEKLKSRENLTFVAEFKADTFKVPGPSYDYRVVLAVIIELIIAVGVVITIIKFRRQTKSKREYYQGLFETPEYTPPHDFHVAEMAENYVRSTKLGSNKVATLMELAVNHKIELIKSETTTKLGRTKTQWKVKIKSLALTQPQVTILKILAGSNSNLSLDQEIVVKSHTATHSLIKLGQDFTRYAREILVQHNLMIVDTKKKAKAGEMPEPKNPCGWLVLAATIILFAGIFVAIFLFTDLPSYRTLVGGAPLVILFILILIAIFITSIICSSKLSPFFTHTEEGLKYSRYLDGLKLYISMAEADRLKFLQSVDGADTTNQGIVKLYEKLLPYATLFKLEKSWLEEMGKYYEMQDVSAPVWYVGVGAFSARDFSNTVATASNTIATTTTHSTTSNSSSGFSGGGGGGFSGGGGGGGGGGGW